MQSLGTPISYHRLNRQPLDDMEVFNSLRDLMDYCDTGARYDGQRVAVLADTNFEVTSELSVNNEIATTSDGDIITVKDSEASLSSKYTEYIINKNTPMINMRGSEPIFKSGITFQGDSTLSHGLLIYEYNSDKTWEVSDVFRFDEGALCLLNQLEIFRLPNIYGTNTYKFYMERVTRDTGAVNAYSWNQTYNPFIDSGEHAITPVNGAQISEMSFCLNESCWLVTNTSGIYLMPRTDAAVSKEKDIITRIYIKAEDYYNIWR